MNRKKTPSRGPISGAVNQQNIRFLKPRVPDEVTESALLAGRFIASWLRFTAIHAGVMAGGSDHSIDSSRWRHVAGSKKYYKCDTNELVRGSR